jgi:hypothetical protein
MRFELTFFQFFVNHTEIDFSSVEDEEPDQELIFTSHSQTLEFDFSKLVEFFFECCVC